MSNQPSNVSLSFDAKLDPVLIAPKKDNGRIAANCAQLVEHKGKTFLAATDGRALSMIGCETSTTEHATVRLARDLLTHSRKAKKSGDVKVEIDERTTSAEGFTTQRIDTELQRYPDVGGVVDSASDTVKVRIGIDAELLAKLQKAIGAGSVLLEIPADSMQDVDGTPTAMGPIAVRKALPGKADCVRGSFGVIMPVSPH